jgi:CheY-like chemotaxis protein
MKEDEEQCLAAGMDAYLAKPIDFTRLAAAVRKWSSPPAAMRQNEVSGPSLANQPSGELQRGTK